MKRNVLRKSLVIGIIILFFGASICPSISGNNKDVEKTGYIQNENEILNMKNDDYHNLMKQAFENGVISNDDWLEQDKLLASDGAYFDNFGCSVSIDGDYAIVGAWRDDDNGNDSGSAYIFTRSGATWTEQAKLLASDGADHDFFGCSVSIDGDYAILGADSDDDNGDGSGSAYVFGKAPSYVWVNDDFNTSTSGWGYDHFDKIQDGIDAVDEGGTVFVYNGTYYENVIIDKSIDFIGENRDTTVIDGNNLGDVVYVSADFVNITGFTIKNGYVGIRLDSSSNNTITGNNASNNYYGIRLYSSSNNTVTGNNASNNNMGIYLSYSSDNNTITGNNITSNNWYGISLYSSSDNNIIMGNNISNNHHGIYLTKSSDNNIIMGNNISSNNDNGIALQSSSNSTITGNNISNNYYGIGLSSSSDNNIIMGNNISSNTQYGISLSFSSNNTVTGNNANSNNNYGIHLSSQQPTSSNNNIYHNNLINNVLNAHDGGNNQWDNNYPSGGNYWDDYTGIDSDGDGIGDTPYSIPGGDNEDRYPLMEPYSDKIEPIVDIINPEKGLYFFNKKIRDYLLRFRIPLIIGRITIEVNATDNDSGVEKVEFYINGQYVANDTSYPYTFDWKWNRPRIFHWFIIKVKAIDYAGNTAVDRMIVRKIL